MLYFHVINFFCLNALRSGNTVRSRSKLVLARPVAVMAMGVRLRYIQVRHGFTEP